MLALGSSTGLPAATRPRIVLLVPLTGPRAGLGLSMQRAAAIAQGDAKALTVIDSAKALRLGRPALVLGPVEAAQVRPALAAAGGAPVLAFSNDETLAGSGAFLLGLTPAQVTVALLRYARGRGVRAVAMTGGTAPWDERVRTAAARAAPILGLTIAAGEADALLATGAGQPEVAAARAAGRQLLLAKPSLDPADASLAGAWTAAPDPDGLGSFADRYRATAGEPGLLAALAYDAAGIAARVGAGGRAALLAPAGFAGAAGAVRFRADGTAERTLAILAAEEGQWRVVGQAAGG